jgi:hypothetical protein
LLPALLHRARLEAVRQAASVDGEAIDPWHLAAVLEGLRPRLDGARTTVEAGQIFDAARAALAHHRWLTAPDFDEEGEVRAALAALTAAGTVGVALLDAAAGARAWIAGGGARAPLRAALVRHWIGTRTLRAALPLLGTAAFRADTPWEPASAWMSAFLDALAAEAAATLDLLLALERGWLSARRAVADVPGRRRHSRAPAAVDLLAMAPLASAMTLARVLGVAPKNALAILDGLLGAGVAVEVTGRSARRLFGLSGMAPMIEAVAPPRRPEPGRGRGRPRQPVEEVAQAPAAPPPLPPASPLERAAFDYSGLEAAMDAVDDALRRARRGLGSGKADRASAEPDPPAGT